MEEGGVGCLQVVVLDCMAQDGKRGQELASEVPVGFFNGQNTTRRVRIVRFPVRLETIRGYFVPASVDALPLGVAARTVSPAVLLPIVSNEFASFRVATDASKILVHVDMGTVLNLDRAQSIIGSKAKARNRDSEIATTGGGGRSHVVDHKHRVLGPIVGSSKTEAHAVVDVIELGVFNVAGLVLEEERHAESRRHGLD